MCSLAREGRELLSAAALGLAPAVAYPRTEHARLVPRLTQVEVALVGVDDRVLVRQVGDVKFSHPMACGLIEAKTQIHDRVARLQNARKTIGPVRLQGIPHVAFVRDVELAVSPEAIVDRRFVACVPAPA